MLTHLKKSNAVSFSFILPQRWLSHVQYRTSASTGGSFLLVKFEFAVMLYIVLNIHIEACFNTSLNNTVRLSVSDALYTHTKLISKVADVYRAGTSLLYICLVSLFWRTYAYVFTVWDTLDLLDGSLDK